MSALITTYYREHDDFRQYTAASKKRMTDLSRVYKKTGRHFADILSSLKLGGSGVSVALRVAPLGVSVLPLHASLSACNLDMPLSTAPGAGCGGIPNRSWTGFVVGVSCMPSPKGLSAGLSTRDYGITVHIYFSQFISSLKVGAFLLISFCNKG